MYIWNQEQLKEGKYAGKDMEEVVFDSNVKLIPENCFNGCKNLKKIIFQDHIFSIDAAAFMGCENLQTINAHSVGIIEDFAFHGCNNVVNFNIKEDIANNIIYGTNNDNLSTYFLLPKIGTSFNDISWHKIDMISKQDKASEYFKIGDKKELIIDEYNYKSYQWIDDKDIMITHPKTKYQMQILDFNHDILSKNPNSKASITIGLNRVMETGHIMNFANTNIGGWEQSEMRNYLNTNVYNNLSEGVKKIIKPVNKLTSKGNNSNEIEITSDKLFLLSEIEIFGSTKYSANGEGSQYQYYINNNANKLGSYWERSSYIHHINYFCAVENNEFNYYGANCSDGVVFAFCI